MAEAAQLESASPSTPASSADPSLDGLDSALAELETKLFPTAAPTQAPTPPAPDVQADPDDDWGHDDDATAAEPADEALDAGEPTEKPDSAETPRPSRREAARLRDQLLQAESAKRDLEGRLNQHELTQREALQKFVDLVLPDDKFEALRVQAEAGDWEAKQALDTARYWRGMAAPIWNAALQTSLTQVAGDFKELRSLEGMDEANYRKLLDAKSSVESHRHAYNVGKLAAKDEIAALKADLSALKTKLAAGAAQPASASGRQPSSSGIGLSGLLGPDGLPTDEAMNLPPDQMRARFRAAA